MVLPKRTIRILPHALHRAWERLQLDKPQATAAIRRMLRTGAWYENPGAAHEFMVLGHQANRPTCAMAVIEEGTVVVTTVFLLTNTARVRAYQQHGDPIDARTVAERYGLGG